MRSSVVDLCVSSGMAFWKGTKRLAKFGVLTPNSPNKLQSP